MHNIDYSFIHSFLKMSKSVFNFNAFKNVAHGRNRRHTAYSRSKFFMHFFFVSHSVSHLSIYSNRSFFNNSNFQMHFNRFAICRNWKKHLFEFSWQIHRTFVVIHI